MGITRTLEKESKSFEGFMSTFGGWGKGEPGIKTVRRIRLGWKKRLKQLGL